jgi:hypothetical protein
VTETTDLTRRPFDHVTTTGTLDLRGWCDFKREHHVEPQQIEPVLVDVTGHLCRLCADVTAEANRLSHALSRRGG